MSRQWTAMYGNGQRWTAMDANVEQWTAMPWHGMTWHDMPCRAWHGMASRAMSCYTMACHSMLWHAAARRGRQGAAMESNGQQCRLTKHENGCMTTHPRFDCEVSSLDQLVMRMYMGMLSHAVWNIPEFSALDKLCVMVHIYIYIYIYIYAYRCIYI